MRLEFVGILGCCVWLAVGVAGCFQRETYIPVSDDAAGIIFTETAPGFSVPDHAPRVLLVWARDVSNPTVSEQKLAAVARRVVTEQGGVLTLDPAEAELVFSIRLEVGVKSRQSIEMVATRSRAHTSFTRLTNGWQPRDAGWADTVAYGETPVVTEKQVSMAYITIALLEPDRQRTAKDEFSARNVWQGVLELDLARFWKVSYQAVDYLFRHLGLPDGTRKVRL